jgi:arginase
VDTENQQPRLSRRVRGGRQIEVIGVACGAGAPDPGCGGAPDALCHREMVGMLSLRGLVARWNETLYPDPATAGDPYRTVRNICRGVAARTAALAGQGAIPVVLGGDHSCAVGTWKGIANALAPRGDFGLIWIDAHMDAHTPCTTPSGMLHGMPLACLLGHGEASLTGLAGARRLDPERICLVGVRSYEAAEAALLRRLGVRVFSMAEIRRRGLAAVMRDALAIADAGTAGFGVTIDLDALDPEDAPGVGSPVPGGLYARELLPALERLGRNPALAGIEIAEYNPHRDREERTARLVPELLAVLLAACRTLRRAA